MEGIKQNRIKVGLQQNFDFQLQEVLMRMEGSVRAWSSEQVQVVLTTKGEEDGAFSSLLHMLRSSALLSQMERKKQENKMRRDQLNDEYLELLDKQRLYFKTVKDFKEVRGGPPAGGADGEASRSRQMLGCREV